MIERAGCRTGESEIAASKAPRQNAPRLPNSTPVPELGIKEPSSLCRGACAAKSTLPSLGLGSRKQARRTKRRSLGSDSIGNEALIDRRSCGLHVQEDSVPASWGFFGFKA